MEQPMPEPGAPPAGQPMPPDPNMQSQPVLGEATDASPEEQAQYEHFVAKAFMLIYDERMLPKVVDMLRGDGDPQEGLARATATIVMRVAQMAEQAGEKISGDVLLHAGKEIFEDLAELAGKAGVHDFSQDQDAFEGAFFRAIDQFRGMLQESGKLDQAAAAADLEKLAAMDQSGELEQMFRGLAKDDAGPSKGEPAPEDDPAAEPDGKPAMPRGGLMEGIQ